MKTDLELQQDVHDALEFEPGVNASHVGVTVDSGVVALRGEVATYQERLTAERTARRVEGVRAVANDLEVKPTGSLRRSDPQIAKAVANMLDLDSAMTYYRGSGFCDADYRVGLTYGARSLPMTFLVDRQGVVRHQIFGARDWGAAEAQQLVQMLMKS